MKRTKLCRTFILKLYIYACVCLCIYIYARIHIGLFVYQPICLMSKIFANGPVERGPIPGRVILKTQKTVLDSSLLSTRYYKICIKGKVEQSRERSNTLTDASVAVNYGCQLYFSLYIFRYICMPIYMYMHICVYIYIYIYKQISNE